MSIHLGIRQLEVIRQFSYSHSVSETARLLHVSQPAVSQMIKDIEDRLGFPIIVRSGNVKRLSKQARSLLPKVELVLEQMSTLVDHVEGLRASAAESLSVAAVPVTFAELMPLAISRFVSGNGGVQLRAEAHSAVEAARLLAEGEIDMALLPGSGDLAHLDKRFILDPILETAPVCVVPKANPLAGRRSIGASDLSEQLVIVLNGRELSGPVGTTEGGRQTAGQSLLEVNQSVAALRLVEANVGVAVLHPLALPDVPRDVVVIPYEPRGITTLVLARDRKRATTKPAYRFEECLRIAGAELSARMTMKGFWCRSIE